jgi:hypothetical protein
VIGRALTSGSLLLGLYRALGESRDHLGLWSRPILLLKSAEAQRPMYMI